MGPTVEVKQVNGSQDDAVGERKSGGGNVQRGCLSKRQTP